VTPVLASSTLVSHPNWKLRSMGDNLSRSLPKELEVGDCWIATSLADSSGLILAARVGKHTDELLEERLVSTAAPRDSEAGADSIP
jgi:hypothetical protein